MQLGMPVVCLDSSFDMWSEVAAEWRRAKWAQNTTELAVDLPLINKGRGTDRQTVAYRHRITACERR